MFGNKKVEDKNSLTRSTTTISLDANALNSLVKGTNVEGNITAENDIRVDGIIKGTLTCQGKVIIGVTGYINGEVKCQNAVVEGKFHGKLDVSELLSVKETAEVIGDVKADKLMVMPGAVFNVTCNMRPSQLQHKNLLGASVPEILTVNGVAK